MNDQSAANASTTGPEWDSSLEVRFSTIDTDYEWLGYEAVHPLTWVPNSAVMAGAPAGA